MKDIDRVLEKYIQEAPLALALERVQECYLFNKQIIVNPVLDIGCGDGIFASICFKQPIDVGVDINTDEIAKAHQTGCYAQLYVLNASTLPFKTGSFKTIISNSVLEHIPEIDNVLKEAYRVLHDDGRFFITVPTDKFEQYTITHEFLNSLGLKKMALEFRRGFNAFWKHHHCYQQVDWVALWRRAGFDVVNSQVYQPRFNCLVDDALVPLSIGSFIVHRLFKRWFLFPRVRRWYAPLLARLVKPLAVQRGEEGGLVFFELKKRVENNKV